MSKRNRHGAYVDRMAAIRRREREERRLEKHKLKEEAQRQNEAHSQATTG